MQSAICVRMQNTSVLSITKIKRQCIGKFQLKIEIAGIKSKNG